MAKKRRIRPSKEYDWNDNFEDVYWGVKKSKREREEDRIYK